MLYEPTHWQVWTTVEGALDRDETVADAAAADELAGSLSLAYRDQGLAYEVFVLAHYCAHEDCECVQWSQDHRPRYSYNPSTAW